MTRGRNPELVPAAGALVWRRRRSGIEVALVHRSRYDDWSWPKGKLDPGETFAQAAAREVLEETGLPYEPHLVDITKNESWTPEFLSLNPNGKIPAIIDPNGPGGKPFGLFESGAILVYLADKAGKLMLLGRGGLIALWCKTLDAWREPRTLLIGVTMLGFALAEALAILGLVFAFVIGA